MTAFTRVRSTGLTVALLTGTACLAACGSDPVVETQKTTTTTTTVAPADPTLPPAPVTQSTTTTTHTETPAP